MQREGQRREAPDAKLCLLCNAKDSDRDPVIQGAPWKWANVDNDGKTVGDYCWYCDHVWRRRYRSDKTPIEFYCAVVLIRPYRRTRHNVHRRSVIDQCAGAGRHDIRIVFTLPSSIGRVAHRALTSAESECHRAHTAPSFSESATATVAPPWLHQT